MQKTVKYAGDQLFHTISRDNNPTTLHFMYYPHHEVDVNQVLNGLPCIFYEELLVNRNAFITISVLSKKLWVFGINKSPPSPTEISNITRKQ